MFRHKTRLLTTFIAAALIVLCSFGVQSAEIKTADAPKLAILLVFDQLRGDYISRWQNLYGNDGFRRLCNEGAWFRHCHYPYSDTVTAAGHASMLSGCSPAQHGIIGNEWHDRVRHEEVYCVHEGRYTRVPPVPTHPPVEEKLPKTPETSETEKKPEESTTPKKKVQYNVSPERMWTDTLGDCLHRATIGKGKVVSLSHKDRSSVLPAGRSNRGICYWFDHLDGQFVTSTFYREKPHHWVKEFNELHPADRWFGRDWMRLESHLDYTAYSGPDDVRAEGRGVSQGRVFPHPLHGGLKRPAKAYYDALYNTPYCNELLLELAERAIEAEQLGMRDAPDLLCLSFSSNDAIGHCWGPDSQEVLDCTLRTDRLIANLLQYLDRKVGKGRYTLALTADHGICPLPEVAKKQGYDAERVPPETLNRHAEAHLDQVLGKNEGKNKWIDAKAVLQLYTNPRLLKARAIPQHVVEEKLAAWLRLQPGIQAVYTRTRILAGLPSDDLLGKQILLSFVPDRSGDVFVVLKPYHLLGPAVTTGTTHGSPHSYDTHVPLIVFGPGVRPGVHDAAVTPQACSAILGKALGIAPPTTAEVGVPFGLFLEANP